MDGLIDLLSAASDKESNPDYDFFLKGDLNQMAEQKLSMILWGFDVKQNDVYPSIKKSDAAKALELILNFKVNGWWNYRKEYVQFNILSPDESIGILFDTDKNYVEHMWKEYSGDE